MKTIVLKNLSEIPEIAKSILEFSKDKKILCFYGELGAGKTTLIKELCKQLGVTDAGSSPTFSLVNEYITPPKSSPQGRTFSTTSPLLGRGVGGEVIYHFDLYRLKSESEIYDIGYEDYIFSGNYCFIEWPEKIENLLPPDYLKVQIQVQDGERIITIS